MSTNKFDLNLIPEYDSSGVRFVVEWLEKLELVCSLQGISKVANVIPLRLTGGAFAVYLQLPESNRKSTQKVIAALLAAFAADPYVAYKQFINRRLCTGETPDVCLASASVFGGMTAFVAGLPEGVRQLLRTGSRMEDLDISQILVRAQQLSWMTVLLLRQRQALAPQQASALDMVQLLQVRGVMCAVAQIILPGTV